MLNPNNTLIIPADVPEQKHAQFTKHYNAITRETGRLFLFSCDHKVEHLNRDFYGQHISPQTLHPEHMFRIASQGSIGAMATHLGLIARYAKQYPSINYIVKLNGHPSIHSLREHSGRTEEGAAAGRVSKDNEKIKDPKSLLLWDIEDIIDFKNNNKHLSIPGIGITIYLGNEYESEMLAQAAHVINRAHNEGLVTIAWIYLRGKAITQECDPNLIAGAAGVGVSLGADFIKIKAPVQTKEQNETQHLKIISAAAGNSKIIYSGGEQLERKTYLQKLYDYIHQGDAAGTATGRNIFQLPLQEAVALTHAISSIVYNSNDLETALTVYAEQEKKSS